MESLVNLPELQLDRIYFFMNLGVSLLFIAFGIMGIVITPPKGRGRLLASFTPKQRTIILRFTGIFFFTSGLVVLSGTL